MSAKAARVEVEGMPPIPSAAPAEPSRVIIDTSALRPKAAEPVAAAPAAELAVPAAAGEPAPKRRGRPPGSGAKRKPRTAKGVEPEVDEEEEEEVQGKIKIVLRIETATNGVFSYLLDRQAQFEGDVKAFAKTNLVGWFKEWTDAINAGQK